MNRLALYCAVALLMLSTAAQSLAQCGGSPRNVQALRKSLADMSTTDPAVMEYNLHAWDYTLAKLRGMDGGTDVPDSVKKSVAWQAYLDADEFWRQKRAHASLGDMAEVTAGGRYTAYLKSEIASLESPVGTWNWWNGYKVTFNKNGGATYQGTSLVDSGVGRWDKTGTDSFHVHWLKSNTNDYFTLSSDSRKISGKFDGKPGVSTRRC